MVIQVEEVIKRFNGKLALDCFNLEVEKGEVIGLLGPNGAGKTTSIRSIIGLIPVDDGRITVFGQKQDGRNKDIKWRIGYVTQELTIYEDMSARENLAFFGSLYGLSGEHLKARIETVSALIGLNGRLKDKVKTFSGGMKRRLNIGCSLLHEPELIARIKGDSHILIDVRIASEEVRKELLAIPDLKDVVIEGNQYHIIVPGGISVFDKIIPVLAPHGIVNINSKQPDLEDVFLTLTGKQLRDEA